MADRRGVLLVAMPFSAPHYPSLALGLLKPAAEAAGAWCETRYFSLDYLQQIGPDDHAIVTEPATYMAQLGEWVFAAAADQRIPEDDTAFLSGLFRRDFPDHYTADRLFALLSARAGAAGFLDRCMASVDWSRFAMVGFTTSFQQTMASLALARRIKRDHPHVLIAFGGANCQDDMGIELHRQYSFIDVVCLGEGDLVFPELVARVLRGAALDGIPAMVVRRDGATVPPSRASEPVTDMDRLPQPDFDGFFAQRAALPTAATHAPALVFETARGCWWGAHQHCTFCGLNGVTMKFRSKSPDRAFQEVAGLVSRYRCRDLANADNILDMRYFDEFLPRLATVDPGLRIFYEVKANLKPAQFAALSRAGVKKVQAGIESLDTAILKLMRKGSTMLVNVAALKLAAEAGIYVEWLALRGFPGETAAQYDAMARLAPALHHLQAPSTFQTARADRFSPWFTAPETFGVTLDPLPAYAHIFAADADARCRLGYHFTMRSTALDQVGAYTARAGAAFAAWQAHQADSALWCEATPSGLAVEDRRWGWPGGRIVLDGVAAALLTECAQITPWRTLAGLGSPAAVEDAAAMLEARGLLLREDGRALALPLRQPGFRAAPSWREIRAGRVTPYLLSEPVTARGLAAA